MGAAAAAGADLMTDTDCCLAVAGSGGCGSRPETFLVMHCLWNVKWMSCFIHFYTFYTVTFHNFIIIPLSFISESQSFNRQRVIEQAPLLAGAGAMPCVALRIWNGRGYHWCCKLMLRESRMETAFIVKPRPIEKKPLRLGKDDISMCSPPLSGTHMRFNAKIWTTSELVIV